MKVKNINNEMINGINIKEKEIQIISEVDQNIMLNDFDAITYNLPSSNSVDTRIFGRLLEDSRVVASYKMYWLLGILE